MVAFLFGSIQRCAAVVFVSGDQDWSSDRNVLRSWRSGLWRRIAVGIIGRRTIAQGKISRWLRRVKKLVPHDFAVPEKLDTAGFRLRMLTANDVVKVYDAVMTS